MIPIEFVRWDGLLVECVYFYWLIHAFGNGSQSMPR